MKIYKGIVKGGKWAYTFQLSKIMIPRPQVKLTIHIYKLFIQFHFTEKGIGKTTNGEPS